MSEKERNLVITLIKSFWVAFLIWIVLIIVVKDPKYDTIKRWGSLIFYLVALAVTFYMIFGVPQPRREWSTETSGVTQAIGREIVGEFIIGPIALGFVLLISAVFFLLLGIILIIILKLRTGFEKEKNVRKSGFTPVHWSLLPG